MHSTTYQPVTLNPPSILLILFRTLTDSLSQAQLNELQLGAAALETISSARTSSVQRAIPFGVFTSKSTGGNTVDFGSVLESRYTWEGRNPWEGRTARPQ